MGGTSKGVVSAPASYWPILSAEILTDPGDQWSGVERRGNMKGNHTKDENKRVKNEFVFLSKNKKDRQTKQTKLNQLLGKKERQKELPELSLSSTNYSSVSCSELLTSSQMILLENNFFVYYKETAFVREVLCKGIIWNHYSS